MKTQTEFYNQEQGFSYFEQYFTTQTKNKISIEEWNNINEFIQEVVDKMSNGDTIVLELKKNNN
jgi:hypothetical protein